MTDYKQMYMTQKRNAEKRDIPFLLTFEEWYQIWQKSGHLENRGRGKGKYVMCRNNDIGPYDINNVYIDLNEINAGLARLGDKSTIDHCDKISSSLKNKRKTKTHIINNALSQLTRPKYNCPNCDRIISGYGNLKQHIAGKHKI